MNRLAGLHNPPDKLHVQDRPRVSWPLIWGPGVSGRACTVSQLSPGLSPPLSP